MVVKIVILPDYDEQVLRVPAKSVDRLRAYCADSGSWYHSFRFEGGIITQGADPSPKKLRHLCLPSNLSGLSVLDIGAYEGFFSFHCKQRGASRVVASDEYVWNLYGCNAREHFCELNNLLQLDIEDVEVPVERLASRFTEPFDIVLFLGVLYHADNMVEFLRQVAAVTRQVCVLETYVDMLEEDRPAAEFFPPDTLNHDSSNWWGPNLAAVEQMALRCGFSHCTFINMWDVNTRKQMTGLPHISGVRSGRVTFYLYK